MKPQLIGIGIVLAGIAFYFLRTKLKASEPLPGTDTRRPSQTELPTQPRQNDKLVLVEGISYSDLKSALTGFCNMYNEDHFQAQLRLTKTRERAFAITFPYDIDFEIFCYFVNYLHYPIKLNWSPEVTAWTTIRSSDTSIAKKAANKRAMLFIPADDTEHDNVYMTTEDNIGYKIGFAMFKGNQLLDSPKKPFLEPGVELSALSRDEFEDFR